MTRTAVSLFDRPPARRACAPELAAGLPRLHRMLTDQRQFRRDQLAQLASQERLAQIEVADRPVEDVDASADSARLEVSAAVAAAARQALYDVEEALDRMHEGRYGRCTHCAAEIPVERLLAIPQAALCMRCQAKAEARR
jgi:RNA polymerase-binding transcription factor DksA